jgi:hypothetical protein
MVMESDSWVAGRAFFGGLDMQIDPSRAASWRERADEYRARSAACVSPGAQFAFIVLAKSADELADRIEQGTLTALGLGEVKATTPRIEYAAGEESVSRRA